MKYPALACLIFSLQAHAAEPHNYAQHLVDAAMLRHPEVRSLTLSAAPGKTGVLAEVASAGVAAGHPAAAVALQDAAGDTIGALTLTLKDAGSSPDEAQAAALALRGELRRRLVNAANLRDPFPYIEHAPSAPYAQQLVDAALLKHPDLLVIALHVAAPDGKDYPIIASSIGRIGKRADEDDLRVINDGKPATGAYGANKTRFGIELPMFDAAGALIGALSVGYAFQAGADEQALLRRAQAVEAELRAQIPDLASLYRPAR